MLWSWICIHISFEAMLFKERSTSRRIVTVAAPEKDFYPILASGKTQNVKAWTSGL